MAKASGLGRTTVQQIWRVFGLRELHGTYLPNICLLIRYSFGSRLRLHFQKEADMDQRKPLEENEIIVHVPRGTAKYVKIEEQDKLPNEIVVQVSKKRKPATNPVLGVIVK